MAVLGAEEDGLLARELLGRGGAEAGTHRLDVGLGTVAEGGAEAVAAVRGHRVGGETGVIYRPQKAGYRKPFAFSAARLVARKC